jgi:hypothetical protein
MATEWRSDGVVAWTEREGPGRPPAGPGRGLTTALSAGLAVLFCGILFTDLLCPEHRLWVQALGAAAIVGAVVTAIGLARGWGSAAIVALPTTVCGVAVGLIDSVHAIERGRIVAVAFALLTLGAIWLMWRQVVLFAWDRSVRRSLSRPAVQLPMAAADPSDATGAEPDATSEVEAAERSPVV